MTPHRPHLERRADYGSDWGDVMHTIGRRGGADLASRHLVREILMGDWPFGDPAVDGRVSTDTLLAEISEKDQD